jgi:hypothetical protein
LDTGGVNGMAILVRVAALEVVSSEVDLALRVIGVRLRDKRSNAGKAFAVMHGLHESAWSEERGEFIGFNEQLTAAEGYLAKWRGGLLLGDFNRVLCAKWRFGDTWSSRRDGDKALRRVAGFSCVCCGGDVRHAAGALGTARCNAVGGYDRRVAQGGVQHVGNDGEAVDTSRAHTCSGDAVADAALVGEVA